MAAQLFFAVDAWGYGGPVDGSLRDMGKQMIDVHRQARHGVYAMHYKLLLTVWRFKKVLLPVEQMVDWLVNAPGAALIARFWRMAVGT